MTQETKMSSKLERAVEAITKAIDNATLGLSKDDKKAVLNEAAMFIENEQLEVASDIEGETEKAGV